MGVINDAKKGAAKDSMYSYVKAVELATTRYLNPDSELISGTYTTKDGNLYSGSNKVLDIALKGTKPTDAYGNITLSNGRVTNAELEFDGNVITYDGNIAYNKESSSGTADIYTAGDVIYYNPETNKKCIESEVNNADNAKTGCLKWNVVSTGDNASKVSIDIMLNHNTVAKVAWVSKEDYIAAGGTEEQYGDTGNSDKGALTANKSLASSVSNWDTSIKGTARMISHPEIVSIVKDYDEEANISSVPWLYQNLILDSSDTSSTKYWLSTVHNKHSESAYIINLFGYVDGGTVSESTMSGIRPVITIQKSVISK